MATTPTSFGNVGNLATQIRSQGMGIVADAVTNLQAQTNQSLSYILSQITTSVAATRPVPAPGSNPIAPYTDLPTGFAISNVRYSTNAQGQQTLKMDAVWTPPSDPKYGGSYIIMQKPSDIAPTTRMELNAGKSSTIVFSDFPVTTENWQFWLVSQNTTGQLNTSLTAPIAGTQTVTVSVPPPPLGTSGIEYTSNVSLGVVAVNATNTAEGMIQQFISAGFTPPSDPSWGGVEIRIYDGGNLVAKNDSQISPITVNIPNPTGNKTYTVKLVSYDVNNHSNTETGAPTTTVPVGSVSGSFSTGFINAAIADIININASNITTGSLTAVTVKVTNAGGSGVVSDMTQGFDSTLGANTGLVVKDNSTNARVSVGPLGLWLINSSNLAVVQLIDSAGKGIVSANDGAGGSVLLSGATNQVIVSRTSDGAAVAQLGAVSGSPLNKGQLTLNNAASSPVNRITIGTDAADLGVVSMVWSGSTYHALAAINSGAPATNGTKVAFGTNAFSSGTVTVTTGLSSLTNFVATCSSNVFPFTGAVSGGSIVVNSSTGAGSASFSWIAFGT